MNNYLPLLQTTTLFAGLSAAELSTLLSRLGGSVRSYGKGEALVLAGEPSRRVGIVLSGELEAYRPAPGGVRIPIAQVEPGGVFGDVLGGSSLSSPVTVLAAAPCEVLLLPYERLLLSDGSPAHQRVVQNLVRTISDKYFSLSRRIDLLVMKSLRVNHDYCDRIAFGRKCLMNVASAGKFSSDRTIRQYAEDIWHIQPVK